MENNYRKNWQEIVVSEVCENLDNLRKPVTKSKREPGKIPYYGATGIVDYVKDYIFDEELVLIGEDGADWSKFANTAFIVRGKSWVNNHAHVLRCKKIDPYFFKEYLNFRDLNVYTTGATRGKLNKQSLMNIKLLIPSLSEQKEIVKILLTADKDIEKTDQIIKKTEKLKKGLMQKLLTRGIGHKKFKKTKLGEIPEKWEVVKIKDFSKVTSSKRVLRSEYVKEGIPFYRSKEIIQKSKGEDIDEVYYISKDKYDEFAKKFGVPKKGEILITAVGSLGIPYLIKNEIFYFKDGNLLWLKDINGPSRKYLMQYFQSDRFKNYLDKITIGSSQRALTIEKLEMSDMPLPNKDEQNKIVNILSDVDNKIEINKQIKNKLTQLKKGLMQDLLSGRVRVK